jgi:hypothetical protein
MLGSGFSKEDILRLIKVFMEESDNG